MNTYHDLQLDALGDATRSAILARLLHGPLPVGELANEFPISRPAISQHLRVLRDANLVIQTVDGTRRFYEINSEGFDSLRDFFDQFWSSGLDAFKSEVERRKPKKKRRKR